MTLSQDAKKSQALCQRVPNMFLVIATQKIFSAIADSIKNHQKAQEFRTTHFKERPTKHVTNDMLIDVLNALAKLSEPSEFVFVHVFMTTSPRVRIIAF